MANGHWLQFEEGTSPVDNLGRNSELRTTQCPIFAASLQPVKPYLVNELLNEGYLGHKRLYYGDTTQLCMLIQLMLISHEICLPQVYCLINANDHFYKRGYHNYCSQDCLVISFKISRTKCTFCMFAFVE